MNHKSTARAGSMSVRASSPASARLNTQGSDSQVGSVGGFFEV